MKAMQGCALVLMLAAQSVWADEAPKASAAETSGGKGKVDSAGTGKVRSIPVRATHLGETKLSTGEARERNPIAPAETQAAAPRLDDDVVRERVSKAMRRYQASIGACIQAALRRHPKASGTVELELVIVMRHVTPKVVRNSTGDPLLIACLSSAARTWELPATAHTMPWTVTLTP